MMEFQKSAGRIFALGEDGKVLAEVTFPTVKEGLVDIDHTFVDPILGISSRDLLELTLDACPQAMVIPAHIWTPHFSLLGAFSGFDSL